jgi:thiamine-phosphate pyrophosphorylase
VIACLITDRRRLCPEGTPFDEARRCLAEQAGLAVAAGVDLVQVRERDLETRLLCAIVADCVRLARGTATRVVVSDRLDVALACGADGVHLRGDSMPAEAVRRIAPPPFLVGRSVHHREEAVAAGPVDYLIAGTVFETVSKPDATGRPFAAGAQLLGLEGLGLIARSAGVPVLAIGGVTVERARAVREAGAAGCAAIGLFIGQSGGGSCRAMPMVDLVTALRQAFDSLG